MVKFGGAVTIKFIGRFAAIPPDVPVIVNCDVFTAAAVVAVKVSVAPVALADPNEAVTPEGSPEVVNTIAPENPDCCVMTIEAAAVPPCARLNVETEDEIWNPGGTGTVTASGTLAEMLPEVAVRLAFTMPGAAVALAVSFKLVVDAMVDEVNVAVTPLGSPVTASVAEPVKPLAGVNVSAVVAELPRATVTLEGAAVKVKLGGALTVRLNVAEQGPLPVAVPVSAMLADPSAAAEVAVNVTTLVVEVLAGLKEAVTPLGSPDAASATFPLKFFDNVTVTVLVAAAPRTTLTPVGAAVNEKPAGSVTVSGIATVADSVPDFPVTVTVAVLAAALEDAVSVNVLAPLALVAPNVAVTPLGSPDALNVTVPEKPFCGVIWIVTNVLAPVCSEAVAGEAESANDGVDDPEEVSALIKACPAGVPQPVARS